MAIFDDVRDSNFIYNLDTPLICLGFCLKHQNLEIYLDLPRTTIFTYLERYLKRQIAYLPKTTKIPNWPAWA